ncbi:MAG: DNA repair protein RadA, partial [Chloroflexi bacterium]|nr:DNA repair protein RadA [Chloroflexota bacterium]
MPKTHTQYICQECGRTSPRQMGRCPQCGAWDSMIEEIVSEPTHDRKEKGILTGVSEPVRLD